MSKNKTLFAIATLVCAFFSGCEIIEDDRIVDWAPVNIYIYATDSAGQSIIQPDMPGMTLTFKGETYSVKDTRAPYDSIYTRAYSCFNSLCILSCSNHGINSDKSMSFR